MCVCVCVCIYIQQKVPRDFSLGSIKLHTNFRTILAIYKVQTLHCNKYRFSKRRNIKGENIGTTQEMKYRTRQEGKKKGKKEGNRKMNEKSLNYPKN